MDHRVLALAAAAALAWTTNGSAASAVYWNVFNVEGESDLSADIVTYGALGDMLADQNRTGVFTPNPLGFGTNIVGSGSDGTTYWNVFNVEGESDLSADIVTYGALGDMLADQNRTGVFTPNPLGFGTNIVGSGSDGTTYWNVFNVEGESDLSADIVTYGALGDMLADQNRTGVFTPNPLGFGTNIVGSGSDGTTYWNVFNVEGESDLSADIVTYGALGDMLADQNRTGVFTPNPLGFGTNIVGSGAFFVDDGGNGSPGDGVAPIPVPAALPLMAAALALLGWRARARS